MSHSPVRERIPGGESDPTFRVEVGKTGGPRATLRDAELLTHAEAMALARQHWGQWKHVIDRVFVVDERTGFTADEIGRDGPGP